MDDNQSMVRCFRCQRTISLSFLKRQGYCSYCNLKITGAPVWLPFGAGWQAGEVRSIGRPRGLETIVTLVELSSGNRHEARRAWRELCFRDPETRGSDKPSPKVRAFIADEPVPKPNQLPAGAPPAPPAIETVRKSREVVPRFSPGDQVFRDDLRQICFPWLQ